MNVFQLTFLVNKLEKYFVKKHALGHSNSRYNITFLFLAFVTIEQTQFRPWHVGFGISHQLVV